MAYTIISQNNTTTTLSDENGNVITVPARVTLATSTDYTIKKVNNNSVDLESGDGKIIRGVPACVVLAGGGGGGGGSVDYAKTVQRAETMPTADASNAGQQFLYSGESDATYTHGYIYENVATTTSSSASAEQTVGSTLSDIAVDIDTLESFTGWTTDNSLQIFYTADGWSVDATSLGVTYTGTPNVGDAITITYTAESTTYAWTRVDVQPAGSSYTAGTGIDITNDVISVITPVVAERVGYADERVYAQSNVVVSGSGKTVSFGGESYGSGNAAFGGSAGRSFRSAQYATSLGVGTQVDYNYGVAVGYNAMSGAVGAIQIGYCSSDRQNADANTVKFGNANGNFEIMSADGTIPEARLADTTNAQQGDVLTLDSTGNAVWQAGGGGGSYTAGTGIDITNNTISVQVPVRYNENGAYAIGLATQQPGISVYNSVAVGTLASAETDAVNIGGGGAVPRGTISIGNFQSTPTERGVVLFHTQDGNYNYHTYKMLEVDGTVPADRLASTTGLADGNYRLRLVMASGVPTLEWVAE